MRVYIDNTQDDEDNKWIGKTVRIDERFCKHNNVPNVNKVMLIEEIRGAIILRFVDAMGICPPVDVTIPNDRFEILKTDNMSLDRYEQ